MNVTVNVLLCPAATTKGKFSPEVPKPAPATVTLEMVALAFPLFDSVIVCEVTDPAVTLGKLALAGVAESLA